MVGRVSYVLQQGGTAVLQIGQGSSGGTITRATLAAGTDLATGPLGRGGTDLAAAGPTSAFAMRPSGHREGVVSDGSNGLVGGRLAASGVSRARGCRGAYEVEVYRTRIGNRAAGNLIGASP